MTDEPIEEKIETEAKQNKFIEPPYRMPGLAGRPSMSAARRRRLVLRKAQKEASILTVMCSLCGTAIRSKIRPLAQAKLMEHYQRHHPHVLRFGGLPIMSPEKPNAEG